MRNTIKTEDIVKKMSAESLITWNEVLTRYGEIAAILPLHFEGYEMTSEFNRVNQLPNKCYFALELTFSTYDWWNHPARMMPGYELYDNSGAIVTYLNNLTGYYKPAVGERAMDTGMATIKNIIFASGFYDCWSGEFYVGFLRFNGFRIVF